MSNFKTDPFEFQVEGQHNVEQPKVGGRNACVKHCISSSKRNNFEDIIVQLKQEIAKYLDKLIQRALHIGLFFHLQNTPNKSSISNNANTYPVW